MSLVTKYSESPVKLMENQKLVEIQFPNTATEIIGLKTDNLTKIDVSKCSKDFISTVKSSFQDKTNNKGENVQVINPNMVIEYTASAKLNELLGISIDDGLNINAFNRTMTSHTFEDGKGVITFDGDVTSIGQTAFAFCSGMTSITIPESVTSIGKDAFSGCSGLTSIEIPDGVTEIGNAAFDGCEGLTSITIPDSVTSISEYAFHNCKGLTSVTIGNSVTRIRNYAFSGCKGLTSITCTPETPPTLGSSAIPETTIYVPSASVNAYRTSYDWSSFAIKIIGAPSLTFEDDGYGNSKLFIDGELLPSDAYYKITTIPEGSCTINTNPMERCIVLQGCPPPPQCKGIIYYGEEYYF